MELTEEWKSRPVAGQRTSAVDYVLQDLRDAIGAGHLRVGERLPSESALSARYGVSRTVVREVLRSLESTGLTLTRSGKGTFVVSDQHAHLVFEGYSAMHLMEARPAIEVPAAALAALRRTEEHLRNLQDLTARMEAENDNAIWTRLDASFHLAIAQASGNPVFADVLSSIAAALRGQSELLNVQHHRRSASLAEHRAIAAAIARGSAVEAEDAMRFHLGEVRDALAVSFTSPSEVTESEVLARCRSCFLHCSGERTRRATDDVGPDAPGGSRSRNRRYAVLALAFTAVVASVLAVSAATGLLAVIIPVEFDPGALVRVGLPVARAVHDAAAAVTVGLLVLATFCLGPDPGTPRAARGTGALSATQRWMARAAALTGVGWLVAGCVVIVLTAADVTGLHVDSPGFGSLAVSFVAQIDLGRALAVSALLVAVVATVSAVADRVTALAWAAALSVLALLPLALGGHAAGSRDHMNAVDSLAIHLVGVCVWVGGLAAVLLVAHRLGAQLATVVGRYSTLAGWCFVAVAASGVVNAWLRLGGLAHLASGYGLLVVGKVVALGLLGLAGALHRRVTLRRLTGDGLAPARWFLRLAGAEVIVMGATLGLAVALSRSAPPGGDQETDPVAALLGYPVPPPLTLSRYATGGYPDVLWLGVAAVLIGTYAVGVVRLRRRGDRWPLQRLVFWTLGGLALVWVTSGGPGVYGRLYFSAHMVQHMTLMTVVPLLLVSGAPITLALRALPTRPDNSFGPRELLLRLVHARVLRVLGHPVVAFALLMGSLVVFYYSGLFSLAMFTHTGHVLMTVHFLASGYLFVWALVGIDPGPNRPPYPFRLVLLLVTLGFHAFFAISLMASGTVLAPDWWAALGQTDQTALLDDQQQGGAIAWAAGDVPSLFIGAALLVGWIQSDAQETRRRDRQADRDGDAELRAYNEQLAALARRDQGR